MKQSDMRYLDPRNDLTFRKIFGRHPHLLRSFLNAMLPLPDGSFIESLEYLPADMVPEIPLMKYSIVDVRCKDNTGRQFIVEMQLYWTTSFMQRVLFNASKAYVTQLDKAVNYKTLQPVYALNLVNDIFQPDKKEYYHHYQIVNVADTRQQIEGLEFVFVELPKFNAQNIVEKKLQVLWLRFMTEIDENTQDIPEDLLNSAEISEAIEILQVSAFNKNELASYDKYWDSVRTEKSVTSDYYQKGEEKGLKEGEEKGLKEGLEKGLKEGLEKGMKEGLKEGVLAVAINAKKMGIPPAEIAKMTGLSEADVEKL
jgi:predicted transposase/invertase (TIGR01784 family)